MSLSIRRYEEKDVFRLTEICVDCAIEANSNHDLEPDYTSVYYEITEISEDPNNHFFVLESESGQVLGMVAFRLGPCAADRSKIVAEQLHIAVGSQSRKNKSASILLEFAEQEAKRLGAEFYTTRLPAWNKLLIRWHAMKGYEPGVLMLTKKLNEKESPCPQQS